MAQIVRHVDGLARIPLFSFGFRPFFLGAGLWSACAMPLWIGLMTGELSFAVSYGAVAWHAHEFLFGYVAASVAGFTLTAIPNWTGRLPVRGGPLLALFATWLAGRIALLAIDEIGFPLATIIDSLFLPALGVVVMREIIAGRDWRNLKVAMLVASFGVANILFHVELSVWGSADYTLRGGIAVIVGLITLIGGRITPSFTRNWLAKRASDRLPVPFGRYDMFALAGGAVALASWVVMPEARVSGLALLLAGLIHAYRLSRWVGAATWREPLLLILHVGYGFVPLGFVCVGLSILWPAMVPTSAALHAWTAGAMGVMTLAVMTRASLGHSGRDLTATPATQAIYVAVVIAGLARIASPLFGTLTVIVLTVSGLAWTLGFIGFVIVYAPLLVRSHGDAS